MPALDPLPEWEFHYEEFCSKLVKRLKAGHKEYGDGSFSKPVTVLIDELVEELYDICGWAFLAIARLKETRRKSAHIEERMGMLKLWAKKDDPDFFDQVKRYADQQMSLDEYLSKKPLDGFEIVDREEDG